MASPAAEAAAAKVLATIPRLAKVVAMVADVLAIVATAVRDGVGEVALA